MTARDILMVGIGVVVGIVLAGICAGIGLIWALRDIERKGGGR